ncbi:MAG TPA: S8 family serine peptidase [Gaiellales bacterium]|jgi:subtilase family serine protease|nr:S8 family serine peptidase [Gaiellales bacterium]
MGLCALALLAVEPAGAAHRVRSTYGASHACTSGQVRCMALVRTHNGRAIHAATPDLLPSGMGPTDYHTAYQLPTKTPLVAGSTTVHRPITVAIVDAWDYGYAYNDLTRYSQAYGLPVLPRCSATVTTSCFQKINMGAPTGSARSTGWYIEMDLDIQTVHAICQNCKIVLVEAASDDDVVMANAVNRAARAASIVSNSYGAYDIDGSLGSLDAAYNHPNKAIVVSSGDAGYDVSWPAALNTVVTVGGTSLHVNPDGSYAGETVWGPPTVQNSGGTGSGCANGASGLYPAIPARAFQAAVANWAATGCGTSRGDNDVSAVADPDTGAAIYTHWDGWWTVGGTSLSAPLISAVFALKGNAASVPYPASLLYAKAGTTAFHDVTSGSNDTGITPVPCNHTTTACVAAPGYDLPTGVGTPHGIGGF